MLKLSQCKTSVTSGDLLTLDSGYFSCAFGLIFVYGVLPLVSCGLSNF